MGHGRISRGKAFAGDPFEGIVFMQSHKLLLEGNLQEEPPWIQSKVSDIDIHRSVHGHNQR